VASLTLRRALAVLALALPAAPLGAQTPGLPVYGGGFSPGFEAAGVIGFPQADSRTGEGTALGATGTLALWRVAVAGTVARFDPAGAGAGRWHYGAQGAVKLVGSPLSPLAVYGLAGIGAQEDDDPDFSQVFIPLGASFTLTIPTPIVSIRPWIAPRMDLTRSSVQGETATTEVFALSAGFNLTLLSGLSFRAAWEQIKNDDPTVAFGAAIRF